MRQLFRTVHRLLRPATQVTMGLVICWGFVLVLAQIKPFWMDEWRLLYNLKFKSIPSLFDTLDYTQQFPRVYLVLLKLFAAPFDYSYFTLRFPAFITGVGSIVLAYRLMNRIYGTLRTERYLFLLIIVASATFLKYLVQIKQYEMEIFLALVAIWQLIALAEAGRADGGGRWQYRWLCASFLIAPFFSYTYPIAVAPVFLLVAVSCFRIWRSGPLSASWHTLWRQVFPLLLGMVSIAVFYWVDVARVLHDTGMNCYWQDHMMNGRDNVLSFFRNTWGFFGAPGSGAFYRLLFSIFGIGGFIAAVCSGNRLFAAGRDIRELVVSYAVLLVSVVILLFVAGKLPLGEPRLNAFACPAIAVLVIYWLQRLRSSRYLKLSVACMALLYIGLLGNIMTTLVKTFTNNAYAKAVTIYSNTEDAIIYAQLHQLPIVISPDVAYPDNIVDDIPCLDPIDAASVLKTFPAYKERYGVPVFNGRTALDKVLPAGVNAGIVGDGTNYRLIKAAALQQ